VAHSLGLGGGEREKRLHGTIEVRVPLEAPELLTSLLLTALLTVTNSVTNRY